jgi:hypothetical protein
LLFAAGFGILIFLAALPSDDVLVADTLVALPASGAAIVSTGGPVVLLVFFIFFSEVMTLSGFQLVLFTNNYGTTRTVFAACSFYAKTVDPLSDCLSLPLCDHLMHPAAYPVHPLG